MSLGELNTQKMDAEEKEIAFWVEKKMPSLVQDLIRICKIPSVAVVPEDKQPPYGDACVQVLDEMLKIGSEYGFETQNFDSCVGKIRYGNQEKSIGIWSHLDVVPVGEGWEHDPFDPVVENGYMIARGCQDNKSSAAVALYVLLYMKEHNITLPYNLDAYMGTSEEVGMFDIDYFTAHYLCPELSLVPDSGFPACYGEKKKADHKEVILFDPKHPAVTIMTDTYNRLTDREDKPFIMGGGTYARKLPRAFACGTGMPMPPAPEGMFAAGHGDYHQPDEAIPLKRIENALVIYIKGILEICRTVEL